MIFSFLKKKKESAKFNIYDTSFSEASFDYTVKDVQNRKVDAIICRELINKEECEKIAKILLEKEKFKKGNKGDIINEPKSIVSAELDDLITESYKSFVPKFEKVYEVDLIGKIRDLLKRLNEGKDAKQLIKDNTDLISPANFRMMPSLFLHCGNQFNNVFPRNYNFLSTQVEVHNHLSYFMVIQEPEEGGRITLYDIGWNEAEESVFRTSTIITLTGEKFDLDKKNSKRGNVKLDLKAGDLLIFAGGEIWHRVEEVRGNRKRITFGGFLGFGNKSNTKDDLYMWA